MLVEQLVLVRVGGQFSGDGKKLSLEVPQNVLYLLVVGQRTAQTHCGNGFVGDAVGLGMDAILGDPTAIQQASLALVAILRVDLFAVGRLGRR